MIYTPEITKELAQLYQAGLAADDENIVKTLAAKYGVPERSVIAKLSSLNVYKKKEYVNKNGQPPVKKEELIERIANLLHVNVEILESLEKANKNVLLMLEKALKVEE